MRTLIVLLVLAGCVTAPAAPTRIDPADLATMTLSDRFERHAFADELGQPIVLNRYARPPRVAAFGEVTALNRAKGTIDAVIKQISDASGMAFEVAEGRNTPTLAIVAGDEQELAHQIVSIPGGRDLPLPITCGGYTFRGVDGSVLAVGVVLIRSEISDEQFRACIAQEFTQVMGLPGDLDGAGDTVMDSYSALDHLTDIDKKLLTILYDPRLKPGMSRQEAMPIVRQIIAEKGW